MYLEGVTQTARRTPWAPSRIRAVPDERREPPRDLRKRQPRLFGSSLFLSAAIGFFVATIVRGAV